MNPKYYLNIFHTTTDTSLMVGNKIKNKNEVNTCVSVGEKKKQ